MQVYKSDFKFCPKETLQVSCSTAKESSVNVDFFSWDFTLKQLNIVVTMHFCIAKTQKYKQKYKQVQIFNYDVRW